MPLKPVATGFRAILSVRNGLLHENEKQDIAQRPQRLSSYRSPETAKSHPEVAFCLTALLKHRTGRSR
ncbi:hypothetical protein ACFFYR_29350 [Paraburkholderia dipogonis]